MLQIPATYTVGPLSAERYLGNDHVLRRSLMEKKNYHKDPNGPRIVINIVYHFSLSLCIVGVAILLLNPVVPTGREKLWPYGGTRGILFMEKSVW
jgi:hypothetical protein